MNIKRFLSAVLMMFGASFAAQAVTLDLTTTTTSGDINGGTFAWDQQQPTGTGVLEPFLRLQHVGQEEGYNSTQPNQGAYTFDEKHGVWTHDLLFGDMTPNGSGFFEFVLDLGEPVGNGQQVISLDNIQIYQASTGGQQTTNLASLGTLLWNMDIGPDGDSVVLLDANRNGHPGNGVSDMVFYLPESYFAGVSAGDYIVFYSQFGALTNYEAQGTFEEWALIKREQSVPEPLTVLLLGLGLLGLSYRRKVF